MPGSDFVVDISDVVVVVVVVVVIVVVVVVANFRSIEVLLVIAGPGYFN